MTNSAGLALRRRVLIQVHRVDIEFRRRGSGTLNMPCRPTGHDRNDEHHADRVKSFFILLPPGHIFTITVDARVKVRWFGRLPW